jgi:hypothetical protein
VGLKPKVPDQALLAGGHLFNEGDAATRVNDQGYITSVAWSPTMETHIGLGFLLNGRARHGRDGAHGRPSARQDTSARSATRSSSIPREDAPVANLIARTPFDGLLPLSTERWRHGGRPRDDHLRRALRGSGGGVSKALKKAVGCALPPVGSVRQNGATRDRWSGLDQWFVMGPRP